MNPKNPSIKFVKRANMFCLTYWNEKGEQKQEWYHSWEEALKNRVDKIHDQRKRTTS